MPDKRRPCGKGCIRCWQNRLKHANPHAKKYIIKNAIIVGNQISIWDVNGERTTDEPKWWINMKKRENQNSNPSILDKNQYKPKWQIRNERRIQQRMDEKLREIREIEQIPTDSNQE